jgi:hypothetical protein
LITYTEELKPDTGDTTNGKSTEKNKYQSSDLETRDAYSYGKTEQPGRKRSTSKIPGQYQYVH